jgi:hypothetical protein
MDGSDPVSLLFSTSLHLSQSYVIPEDRIRTPRTPHIPKSCTNRRRTRSPTDVKNLGPANTSPRDFLINRIKAATPRKVDFAV